MVKASYYDWEYYDGKGEKSHGFAYGLADLTPQFGSLARVLVDTFHPQASVDIGCAKGFLVYFLRRLGVKAVGVDVSQYALSHSPKEVRGYLLAVDIDNRDLPHKDKTFDLITLVEVLEHLNQPELVIKEAARLLKPGGWLYVTTPIRGTRSARWDISHINVRDRKSWLKLFRSFGFEAKHSLRFRFKLSMEESMRTINPTSGTTKLGKLLGRCGIVGRWLRGILKFVASYTICQSQYFILNLPQG